MDMKKYQPDAEQLEIGKRYEFSDDGAMWHSFALNDIDYGKKHCYETIIETRYRYIREDQSEAGAIKEKQIKLIAGEWYMCEVSSSSSSTRQFPLQYTVDRGNIGFRIQRHGEIVKPLYQLVKTPLDSSCE